MEILFRGFHKQANGPTIVININGVAERGRWVYGYYVGPVGILDTHEIADINDVSGAMYDVEPSTVGAYTGLTDKNGEKIFVGDIINAEGHKYTVNFSTERRGFFPFARGDGCGCCEIETIDDLENIEVIGTIYDGELEGA